MAKIQKKYQSYASGTVLIGGVKGQKIPENTEEIAQDIGQVRTVRGEGAMGWFGGNREKWKVLIPKLGC